MNGTTDIHDGQFAQIRKRAAFVASSPSLPPISIGTCARLRDCANKSYEQRPHRHPRCRRRRADHRQPAERLNTLGGGSRPNYCRRSSVPQMARCWGSAVPDGRSRRATISRSDSASPRRRAGRITAPSTPRSTPSRRCRFAGHPAEEFDATVQRDIALLSSRALSTTELLTHRARRYHACATANSFPDPYLAAFAKMNCNEMSIRVTSEAVQ